jgi:hypothetical protein
MRAVGDVLTTKTVGITSTVVGNGLEAAQSTFALFDVARWAYSNPALELQMGATMVNMAGTSVGMYREINLGYYPMSQMLGLLSSTVQLGITSEGAPIVGLIVGTAGNIGAQWVPNPPLDKAFPPPETFTFMVPGSF